jgi:hypothetical protein
MKLPRLYGQAEFAIELGWDRRKLNTYYGRGLLPKPATYAGKRPLWTKEQIDEYKQKIEEEKS